MAHEPEGKRRAGGDLILPVAALAFTIYYFSTIWSSPWEAQVAAFLVGSILLLLIAILLVRTGRELAKGQANLRVADLLGDRTVAPRRLGLLALTLGYLIGIGWLGFTLTSFLFLFGGMALLETGDRTLRRMPHFAAVAGTLSLVGWLVFIRAFDARFPRGPLEALLEALFG